jgi:hypothetical protein
MQPPPDATTTLMFAWCVCVRENGKNIFPKINDSGPGRGQTRARGWVSDTHNHISYKRSVSPRSLGVAGGCDTTCAPRCYDATEK